MELDAVVVGSGPNGLAAALTLARAGKSVTVFEAEATIGGAARTEETTLPAYKHDLGAAVLPFAAASPALEEFQLESYGLKWLHHQVVATHPLNDGNGATLYRDLGLTAAGLGRDSASYRKLLNALTTDWPEFKKYSLGPLLRVPSNFFATVRSGVLGILPATTLTNKLFKTPEAQALFAGCAAHAYLPVNRFFTSSFGNIFLTLAHTTGWPIAKGGSQSLVNAMQLALEDHGGQIVTNHRIGQLADLPSSKVKILDVSSAAAGKLIEPLQGGSARRVKRLKNIRPGPGAWKIDYALSSPLPFTHKASRKAGTVHLGGTIQEILHADTAVCAGKMPNSPFVIVSQPTIIDDSRGPSGSHIAWVYGHVPYGWDEDATPIIEAQLERFAPGFKKFVLARNIQTPSDFYNQNSNLYGGDITGGSVAGTQLVRRPFFSPAPYKLGPKGHYICSSSTPPGAGVHGMCGWHAANLALREEFR
jgi:phytoene dehydrogenase-like protein